VVVLILTLPCSPNTHDGSDTTSDSFTYQVCDDATSCATATVSITIIPPQEPPPEAQPTITLDPTEGAPGTEVTVTGSGWIPGDTVFIHFAVAGNEVAQATVGDDGSFTATFTVPADAEIGEQLVIAGNLDVSRQTDAPFRVPESTEQPSCPEPTVTLSASSGKAGDTITIQGKGWLPGGTVAFTMSGPEQYDITSMPVPDSGEWAINLHVVDATPPGDYDLVFSENHEGCELTVTQLFTIVVDLPGAQPTITLDPTEGAPGTEVTVRGADG
jgi:hypothetical protein